MMSDEYKMGIVGIVAACVFLTSVVWACAIDSMQARRCKSEETLKALSLGYEKGGYSDQWIKR